jgi:hypothetical protein
MLLKVVALTGRFLIRDNGLPGDIVFSERRYYISSQLKKQQVTGTLANNRRAGLHRREYGTTNNQDNGYAGARSPEAPCPCARTAEKFSAASHPGSDLRTGLCRFLGE